MCIYLIFAVYAQTIKFGLIVTCSTLTKLRQKGVVYYKRDENGAICLYLRE